jgi:hypothetical protein
MKLDGNAALSWNVRRLLVRRAVEDGWTLTGAKLKTTAYR